MSGDHLPTDAYEKACRERSVRTIQVGDVVRYSAEAIQRTQHWLGDQEGEVIEIKGKNTKYTIEQAEAIASILYQPADPYAAFSDPNLNSVQPAEYRPDYIGD